MVEVRMGREKQRRAERRRDSKEEEVVEKEKQTYEGRLLTKEEVAEYKTKP